MAKKDPLIGRQLANFKIERILGHGGMAQVYFGHDVKLQRPVAIKVIDARYRNKPGYAARFVKEARSVARWRHENIIQIYYADDDDGLYYYVMEYIDGKDLSSTLEAFVAAGDLMPIDEVLRIARSVASALDYAHQQGVIHRDVKPSNVMIARDGRVVLGDFGLALDVQQGSLGEVFGTPHYISPEQARRSTDVVPQSDLYSMGVMLYEMLTGVVPFDDPSPTSVALQHITESPPPPRSINPDLNAQTEAVLLKALSKKPQQRYQSGAELVNALAKAFKDLQDTRKQNEILPLPPMPAGLLKGDSRKTKLAGTQLEAAKLQPKAAPLPKRKENLPAPASKNEKKEKKRSWAWLFWLFLLIALGACLTNLFINPRFANWLAFLSPTQTATSVPATLTLTSTTIPATATSLPSPENTATTTPSATSAPTQTFTPSPTALLPTGTLTQTATLTVTSEPTGTFTPQPSPTVTATSAPPTATGTIVVPTASYPNGKKLELFYDDNGFYIRNASDVTRSIEAIAFERLDLVTGAPLNRMDGDLWAEKYANLAPKFCMRIEIYNGVNFLRPGQCEGRYSSQRILYRTDAQLFWTKQDGSEEFRVIWRGEEVGRCKISAGKCEIFIP